MELGAKVNFSGLVRNSFLVVALGALMTTSCTKTTTSRPNQGSAEASNTDIGRTQAPDFSLLDDTAETMKLSAYRGKVVLINFWATWCGPCRVEIPWFIEFEKTYRDRGFAVIGVSMDEEGWQAVRPFLAQEAVNYRVVLGNPGVIQSYGVERPPASFIVDRNGRLVSAHIGLFNKPGYEQEIRRYLGAGQLTR